MLSLSTERRVTSNEYFSVFFVFIKYSIFHPNKFELLNFNCKNIEGGLSNAITSWWYMRDAGYGIRDTGYVIRDT